jgi:hypothetical protein
LLERKIKGDLHRLPWAGRIEGMSGSGRTMVKKIGRLFLVSVCLLKVVEKGGLDPLKEIR